MDINQNIAQCIVNTNNFGSTVIHNICNGTTQVVPWGGVDWAACAGISTIGVFAILFIGTMAAAIISDI